LRSPVPLKIPLLSLCLLMTCASLSAAKVISETNPETGLKSWGFIANGLDLKFLQRLPDQTRGFFLGRGFTEEQANDIATQCVFQTVAKNNQSKPEGKPVSIDLSQWKVFVNGKEGRVKLKEYWKKQWQALEHTDKKVRMSAQIAFRWATFPSQQQFEPGGDYNWGMISFGLPPGQYFDLQVNWLNGDKPYTMLIKNIQCPEDN